MPSSAGRYFDAANAMLARAREINAPVIAAARRLTDGGGRRKGRLTPAG